YVIYTSDKAKTVAVQQTVAASATPATSTPVHTVKCYRCMPTATGSVCSDPQGSQMFDGKNIYAYWGTLQESEMSVPTTVTAQQACAEKAASQSQESIQQIWTHEVIPSYGPSKCCGSAFCGNGIIERDEECESDDDCDAGKTCQVSCMCA
ncbi:hypothetical protein KY311_00005, partial [Candidatus Woesearchaeota archaeon]|nr:hypothetical protein [Candidatus Woesearchaeota archaeon]